MESMDDPILRDQIRSKLEKKALARGLSSVSTGLFEECARPAELRGDQRGPVWTDPAVERLRRVPRGFMRDAAKGTVEEYARKNDIAQISPEVAEKGLAQAREKMADALSGGPAKDATATGDGTSSGSPGANED